MSIIVVNSLLGATLYLFEVVEIRGPLRMPNCCCKTSYEARSERAVNEPRVCELYSEEKLVDIEKSSKLVLKDDFG